MVAVKPSMQLEGNPHVFVVGDAADAFGAISAGHTAWEQAHVTGQNILTLIQNSADPNTSQQSLPLFADPVDEEAAQLDGSNGRLTLGLPP